MNGLPGRLQGGRELPNTSAAWWRGRFGICPVYRTRVRHSRWMRVFHGQNLLRIRENANGDRMATGRQMNRHFDITRFFSF
jgi:hypothetical protein